MTKKVNITTLIIVFVCVIAQFSIISYAAYYESYDVTLGTLQIQKELERGQANAQQYTQIYLSSSSSANYIYIQTQFLGGGAATSGWTQVPRRPDPMSTDVTRADYNQYIGLNTELKTIGYQKNVLPKTAKGAVWF